LTQQLYECTSLWVADKLRFTIRVAYSTYIMLYS
jgi:hypothetical protein